MRLRGLSLFSGIGGLDLAFEWAGGEISAWDCTMECVREKSTGGKPNERRQTVKTQNQQ